MGASYEGLPGFIEPTETTAEMREGLIKDMKLLLRVRHQVPPEGEIELVKDFLKEFEDMPESLKRGLWLIVQSPTMIERRRAHFTCLLYQEHVARFLLHGKSVVKDK